MLAMTTATLTRLTESVFQDSSLPQRINREEGVIRGVKVLGVESANGRHYPLKVMKEASHRYNGVKVNIDHPKRPGEDRPYTTGFGELRNPVVMESGLFADLHYNRKHQYTEQILEDCERFPTNFGLSHNASGEASTKGGKMHVESITDVESVDIVGQPATNSGIWESIKKGKTMLKTVERIIADAPETTPGRVALLEQVAEGLLAPDTPVEVPSPVEDEENAEGGAQQEIKAALKTAVVAAYDDPTLDMNGTITAIKKIAKTHEDLVGPLGDGSGNAGSGDGSGSGGDTKKPKPKTKPEEEGEEDDDEEKKKEVAASESLKRELQATKDLAKAGVPFTEAKVKALMNPSLTTAEQGELLESWKAQNTSSGRPSRSPSAINSGSTISNYQESVKEGFAKATR